tara:strand:- start:3955 stop:4191 length:237 start_codon:yes stop_codon:yes gene_type:complete
MISSDPLVGTLEEKAIENPHESQDEWGFLHSPPKSVKIIYKTTAYAGMIVGIALAFPLIAVSSAKKWYDKSRKDKYGE